MPRHPRIVIRGESLPPYLQFFNPRFYGANDSIRILLSARTYFIILVVIIMSGSAPISRSAIPVSISCGVTSCPVGSSSVSLCILKCSQASEVASSLPLVILIRRLHSGGMGFPLSQFLTALTLLKHSFAVSSTLKPHSNSRKT